MTYVYQCQSCGKMFEISGTLDVILQHHKCPDCKSDNVKKIITAPAIHYKGNGWAGKKDNKDLWSKK